MVKPNVDTKLVALDGQLGRLRRPARRLQHGLQQGTAQWAAWSSAVEDAFGLVDDMMRVSADGSLGLKNKNHQ